MFWGNQATKPPLPGCAIGPDSRVTPCLLTPSTMAGRTRASVRNPILAFPGNVKIENSGKREK